MRKSPSLTLPFTFATAIHELLDIRHNAINKFIILKTEIPSNYRVIQFDVQYQLFPALKGIQHLPKPHATKGYPRMTSHAKQMRSSGRARTFGSRGQYSRSRMRTCGWKCPLLARKIGSVEIVVPCCCDTGVITCTICKKPFSLLMTCLQTRRILLRLVGNNE